MPRQLLLSPTTSHIQQTSPNSIPTRPPSVTSSSNIPNNKVYEWPSFLFHFDGPTLSNMVVLAPHSRYSTETEFELFLRILMIQLFKSSLNTSGLPSFASPRGYKQCQSLLFQNSSLKKLLSAEDMICLELSFIIFADSKDREYAKNRIMSMKACLSALMFFLMICVSIGACGDNIMLALEALLILSGIMQQLQYDLSVRTRGIPFIF